MRLPASRVLIAPVLVALAIALSSCTLLDEATPVKAAVKKKEDRMAAPDFSLKDAQGRTVKLSEYKGKVVLLNFWATWCGPCRIEIPWLIDFEQKYKDRGFAVLGVSMDDDGWESVKPYMEKRKVNYRMVIGDEATAVAYGGVESLPTSFVIDREGRIADVHVGLVSKSVYEEQIEKLLSADRAGSAASAGGAGGTD